MDGPGLPSTKHAASIVTGAGVTAATGAGVTAATGAGVFTGSSIGWQISMGPTL